MKHQFVSSGIAMSLIDFEAGPADGNIRVKWIHGSPDYQNRTDPPIQTHWYNSCTVIIRESKDISCEAPFLYLLFGNERALLIDTGSTPDTEIFPLRNIVDKLLEEWIERNEKENYSLVITHTHGHYDHVLGDAQFTGRDRTTVVGSDIESVKLYFGIKNWPQDLAQINLGGRVVDIIPTPGHDAREITFYDKWTGFLFTGDLIYPGRLYVEDFPSYVESLHKLVAFSESHSIRYLMGCHVEMKMDPGVDYPMTSIYQPDETPLQMESDELSVVAEAFEEIAGKPGLHRFDRFVIFNGPCHIATIKQIITAKMQNFRHRGRKS